MTTSDWPGVRRLRPDDHFMVLAETPESPMQIGALLALQLPPDGVADVFGRLRDHILERLPGTPLLAVLRQAPEGYDSDVWVDVADCDPEVHFERVEEPLDERALEDAAARNSMRPLDLARPPFRVTVFEDIGDGRCADDKAQFIAVAVRHIRKRIWAVFGDFGY